VSKVRLEENGSGMALWVSMDEILTGEIKLSNLIKRRFGAAFASPKLIVNKCRRAPRKDCTFHDIFRTTEPLHLLDLLTTSCNGTNQSARIHPADTNDLSDLGATSQNVMRMDWKADCPNLREDMTLKSILKDGGHFVMRSNDL